MQTYHDIINDASGAFHFMKHAVLVGRESLQAMTDGDVCVTDKGHTSSLDNDSYKSIESVASPKYHDAQHEDVLPVRQRTVGILRA